MPERIAIVGSGFLGLTLALRLAESGREVTVFEAAPEIGGLASAWQIGDVVWDRHYHVTLMSDSFTRKIVGDIGLGDEFEWVETKTGFYTGGKLVSMSNGIEFLKFPPLGLIGKFRLGTTIFYASRLKDWKSLEKVSVENWLTKLSGKKTFDKIWKPLLKAKLGDAYRETSAAFIWATIQRMYAARNSGMKKEMFGYVRGGYARVLARFEEVLREKGVDVRLNAPVGKIEEAETGKFEVTIASGAENVMAAGAEASGQAAVAAPMNSFNGFDSVVLTCPADTAANSVPQLSDAEKDSLRGVKYQGIVCASVLMRKSLSPFYVTNIIEETPFTGIIEMSAMVEKAEFGGNALVYLPKYVGPDDELFEKTDEEIEKIFLDALETMYPQFSRADVVTFKISRVRKVFPLPIVNYSEKLPSIKTSVDGLFVINSAHILNGTLNVNETVQLAENFYKQHFSV
jgi:protoporphyrinogen oxidase